MNKGYIYIVLAGLLFSTAEIAGKVAAVGINPYQLTFLRFLIGAIILLPFARKEFVKRKIKFNKKELLFFLMLGFISIVISMSLFQFAVIYTKASTVAIVFSANPVFTIPFACIILKEKINKKTIYALIISLTGVSFILNPFKLNMNGDFAGIVLAIASAIIFSLYSVLGKKKIEKYGGLAFNCITFICGDAILLLAMIIFKIPIIEGINIWNITKILYMGVFVTGLGYLFYFLSMEHVTASKSSTVFFIKPVLASILASIILGEKIKLNSFIGIMCILFSSYLIISSNKNKSLDKKEAIQ